MVHPRSLDLYEPRPPLAVWTCCEHGDLPPGEVECADCDDES